MHNLPLTDFESNYDADYDCDCHFELESGCMPLKQSIRVPSPLSLSLISESKLEKSEPQHSYSYTSSYSNTSSSSSGSSTSSRIERYGRNRRNYGRSDRSGREMDLYGYGYDEEEEDEMEMSDEGYDSYDASPRLRSHRHLPTRRNRASSPPRSPFSAYSVPLPSCSSPSFPYTYSLPHPEELDAEAEADAEISYPRLSSSTDRIELNHTPSCDETLRRQWHALALRVRFGVFRARRRIRGMVGKGRKY